MSSVNDGRLSLAAAVRFALAAAILSASLLSSFTASAASLQGPISGWQQGSEPSWISMYIYVPDNPAPNPPILVTLHYCGGTAGAVFSQAQNGGMVSLADQNGFILLIPQTSQNCWDVATTPSLTNGGGGDTGAIVHQVEYTISEYGGNADRVYAVGTSGGGMAAQALLAVYPDVFKGGAEFSGVPAGCWAVNNPDGQWSSPCANGDVTHSAQEWGDMVRDMYPGYDGFRPRVQLWHGTGDTTISFVNHTEAIKQWTNVLGLPEEPTTTTNVTVGGVMFTRDEWKDDCDTTVLDVFTEPNGPHNTSANMSGQYSMPFLSLDVVGDTDPQAASECGMSGGGMGGTSGDGMGGTPGDGMGGSTSSGGMGGMGTMSESGGAPSTGGMGAAGGTGETSTGGNTSMGGPTSPSPAGTDPVTGTPTGGVTPTTPSPDPAPTTTGTGMPGTAGTGTNTGTASTTPMGSGTPGPVVTDMAPGLGEPGTDSGGGGCRVQNTHGSGSGFGNALALAGLFVAMFARRRSKR